MIFLILVDHQITITFLWLIPVLFLQMIFAFSIGVILSLFTTFFKDLKETVPVVLQLWFWMTPIIYMKEMIENKYPILLIYNPFFYYVSIYQDIFLYSKAPSFNNIIIISMISFVSFFLAMYLYKKMISTVKDII